MEINVGLVILAMLDANMAIFLLPIVVDRRGYSYGNSKYSIMRLNGHRLQAHGMKPPSTEIKAAFRPAPHGLQGGLDLHLRCGFFSMILQPVPV